MNSLNPHVEPINEHVHGRKFRGFVAGAIAVGSIGMGVGGVDASPDTEQAPVEQSDAQPETVSIEPTQDVVELPISITEHIDTEYSKSSELTSDTLTIGSDSLLDSVNGPASGGLQQATRMSQQPERSNELENLPDPGEISGRVSAMLERNTTYEQPSGCSGYLLRNENGVAIGSGTAEHCGLRGVQLPRYYDELGDGYVLQNEIGSPFSYTGNSTDELTLAGEVSHIIVPNKDDLSQDTAINVYKGQDPQEVLSSMTERPRMNTGDIAYMSGWPVHQNEGQREYGALERQEWAMVFLGYGDVEISSGEYLLDVATFALQSTEDDAECSFGASGSFAVTEFGDHIGALAGFNDLKIGANITNQYDADYVKNSNEQKFGVNLDGFDAICHFTPPINSSNPNQYEILEIREAHESAEVVAEVAERALEDLFDPSTESTYIDGVFEGLLGQKGGPGTLAYVENPVLYTDEQTGHSMLHWSEANEEGMSYTFIPQGDEKTFFFSSERSDGVDNSFVKTKGQISIEGGKFDPNGAYVDNNGVRFGDLRADIPVDNSEFYILSISPDGNTVFQPRVL